MGDKLDNEIFFAENSPKIKNT